jgi:DNA-binding transcriptional ArsR family regulator
MARRANPVPRIDPDIAGLAGALADPSRVAMLDALLDGNAHTIGALARHADITAATASGHLRRLLDHGLVAVAHEGRERRVRLASPAVAQLLEAVAAIATVATAPAATAPAATPASTRRARELRFARTCYDHLAGIVGVRVTRALVDRRWLRAGDDTFAAAPELLAWLADQGHPVVEDPRSRRPLARACLDWSERTPHLAGRIGAAIAELAVAKQWVVRVRDSRALRLTTRGRTAFARELAVTFA